MTEKPIQDLRRRMFQIELENKQLRESLAQAERLDQKYADSLATIKSAKKKLHASESLVKGILDSAIDCIVSMNQKGCIIEFNTAAEKMFGYTRDEVLGKVLSELIIPHGIRDKHQQGLKQYLEGQQGHWLNKKIETTGMRADGTEFPVELFITEVRQSDTLFFSGFIRDLTGKKQEEAKYRTLFESSMDAIMLLDREQGFFDCNKAALHLFGSNSRDDFVYGHPADFSPEKQPGGRDSMQLANERIEVALEQGCNEFEWVHKRLDGTEFLALVRLISMQLGGRPVLQAVVRDISERKNTEEKLQRNLAEAEEARRAMLFMLEDLDKSGEQLKQAKLEWEQTFDAITDPIFLHDMDGNIVRANQTYAGHARMCFEELIGKPYWQVFPRRGDPLPGCLQAGEKAEAEAEVEIQTKKGEIFISHNYTIHGDPPRFAHLLENITKRRHNEQAIMDSKERFRSISETAQDAIIILDNSGKVSLWNPAAEHIFGYARDEAMGREISRLIIPESSRGKHRQGFASFRETGKGAMIGKTVETMALKRDGAEFPVELSISATKVTDKWHAVAIIRDITERRHAADRLQKSLEGTIQVIASAVEARDRYTSGHQRRVAKLATAIAGEMALDSDQVEGIHWGAMIHDIGKIHLPAEILSKPTKLTKLEYNLIKEHVQVGYDILKDIEFPWPVADIVHQHHERMDGSGYPQDLDDGQICLEARIVAVSDVVEAMSSHRPYRPGLGIDKALAEIKRGRGKQYDPQAADACFKLFNEDNFSF